MSDSHLIQIKNLRYTVLHRFGVFWAGLAAKCATECATVLTPVSTVCFDRRPPPCVFVQPVARAGKNSLRRLADHRPRWQLRISERLLACFCVLLDRQLLAQEAFQHFWCDIEGGGLETRYTSTKIKQPQCGSFL